MCQISNINVILLTFSLLCWTTSDYHRSFLFSEASS